MMTVNYNTILIPTKFTVNTEAAIQVAEELLGEKGTIHLLYIQSYSYPALSFSANRFLVRKEKKDYDKAMEKLSGLKGLVESQHRGISVTIDIDDRNSVQEGIKKAVLRIKPDIVVIGKTTRYRWTPFLSTVNTVKLVQQTGIKIITVRPGSIDSPISRVMVPIDDTIEERNLESIRTLVSNRDITIYLIAFSGNITLINNRVLALLAEAREWLGQRLKNKVETKILPHEKRPSRILQYAEKIKADMIILKMDSKCKNSWPREQLTDLIPPSSKIREFLVS